VFYFSINDLKDDFLGESPIQQPRVDMFLPFAAAFQQQQQQNLNKSNHREVKHLAPEK